MRVCVQSYFCYCSYCSSGKGHLSSGLKKDREQTWVLVYQKNLNFRRTSFSCNSCSSSSSLWTQLLISSTCFSSSFLTQTLSLFTCASSQSGSGRFGFKRWTRSCPLLRGRTVPFEAGSLHRWVSTGLWKLLYELFFNILWSNPWLLVSSEGHQWKTETFVSGGGKKNMQSRSF